MDDTMKDDKTLDSMETDMSERLSRRNFIRLGATGLGVAASLPLAAGVVGASQGTTTAPAADSPEARADAAARAADLAVAERKAGLETALTGLLAPLAAGSKLGGATVESIAVDAWDRGVISVADDRGRAWAVEICRRSADDANVRPVAITKHYSLFIRNGANGSTPTDQQIGRVIVALREQIGRNEATAALVELPSRKQLWASMNYRSIRG